MDIQQTYSKLVHYNLLHQEPKETDTSMQIQLNYLKKCGKVSHIRRGIYLPVDMQNKFRIACNSVEDGCLVYHAALEYYLLQTQDFNWLYIHSTSSFRTFEYMNQSYMYKPVKFLYKPILVDKDSPYPIKVTSLSQTIIDCLYNINLAGGIEELLYALTELNPKDLNERDLLHCLKLYNSKSLYQRAGYLLQQFNERLGLSAHFFEVCHKGMGKNISYLVNPYYCDAFAKEWNLCIPSNLMKQIQKDAYYEI